MNNHKYPKCPKCKKTETLWITEEREWRHDFGRANTVVRIDHPEAKTRCDCGWKGTRKETETVDS